MAARAGVTRQAAGQLVAEIERCGCVTREAAPDDARAEVVRFTARGRRLLATIFELVEDVEASFAAIVGAERFATLTSDLDRLADTIDRTGRFGADDE